VTQWMRNVLYSRLHRENAGLAYITSHELESSRPWPRYIWASISQNPLGIECQYRWNTYRKWPMANRTVTWPMTSRDPECQGRDPDMFTA